MRFVIAGGGTAGHVFPGLALAGSLTKRGHEVSFVGTEDGQEARLVPQAGYKLDMIEARPLVRTMSPEALWGVGTALGSVRPARAFVSGADAVVGMGGYASVPPVAAAWREKVPVVLQEQNAIPGLANRIMSRIAAAVAVGFIEAVSRFPRRARVLVTGNPIREEILRVRGERDILAKEACAQFDLRKDRTTIVIFGGSLGALHVDRVVVATCALIRDRRDLQVLLITGPDHLEAIRRDIPTERRGLIVRTAGFVDRMELAYAAADLVVARSGAGSVAEIAACGLPSLLIPYPHAVAGEQEANARALQRAGGAAVMLDDQLSAPALAARMTSLVDHSQRLKAMGERASTFARPDATERVADLVEEAGGR